MSSETKCVALEGKHRKHPLEYESIASSNVFMENKRRKVHVIRDFPKGCRPFIKPIDLAHSVKYKPPPVVSDFPWGCGHVNFTMQDNILSDKVEEDEDDAPVEEHFEDAVQLQSPKENFSDTELDSFYTAEEDYRDSIMEYFGNSWESPVEEGQSDFDKSKSEYFGTAWGSPLHEGQSDSAQSQSFGNSWESSLHEGQSDFAQSESEYFGNTWESRLQEGQPDFAQSQLQCDENYETDEEVEDFAQTNLQYVDNSEVKDNFAQSESSALMRKHFDSFGRTELFEVDLEEEDLEENRINHYPALRVRSFSVVRDFPLVCGSEPRVFGHDMKNQSHEVMLAMKDTEERSATSCNNEFYQAKDVRTAHDNRDRMVVLALMAAPNCPWRNMQKSTTSKPKRGV